MQAIGVVSKDAFPDNRFSASSGVNIASNGRLNGAGAWSPSTNNDAHDYLQIDLLYEFVICAVATQGNPNADHWTTKYKLQLALIDIVNKLFTYQEDNTDKVSVIQKENRKVTIGGMAMLKSHLMAIHVHEMLATINQPEGVCSKR